MSGPTPAVTVTDAAERRRFEGHLDGVLVGWIDYADAGQRIVLRHAETVPAYGGRGIGGAIVQGSLDLLRRRPDPPQVVPICGFVAHWIARHPEYGDAVDRG